MKRLLLFLLGLILVGCEAQATPIAAVTTPTITPQPTTPPLPELRYGVGGNIAPYVGDLDAVISYEIVDSAIEDYDIVVAYGVYDGWQQAPQSHRVSLVINPNLAPLDNLQIRELIPQIIDRQAIVDSLGIPNAQSSTAQTTGSASLIRTTLANAGYPDGFQLTMATESIPALDILVSQFSRLALDLRLIDLNETVLSANQAHLILFLWAQESERAEWANQVGEENVIDLWTMPISYIVSEGLAIEFNENGLPIPLP